MHSVNGALNVDTREVSVIAGKLDDDGTDIMGLLRLLLSVLA